MKTSLSSITNLSISPRGRKLPVSIYEFVATVLSEYALSNLKVDSNDSAFHSISSYFVGGEILAKDLIQKLLIIPEIASIFDCFPSMGNGKEYDYAVWSQFLSDTTWEYDGKSSVFVFKEHTYAMENKVLILEKEPDGLFAKRLHCDATEQYYGRIGPGAREDKTAIQAPPIFTPRPQEVTMQDEDVEKAVSDSDFFTLDESLQGADPQQREAITSGIDKNLIILAGAGSGKTRTLVARLAYLRAVKKIPLNRILLLTFTVAAAAEMRSRGKSLVDVIYSNIAPTKKATVNARTIDSFVIQLVNTYYPQMGFSQKPVIYYSDNVETKQQKIQMLSEIIRENKLEGIFRFYLAGAGTQPEKLGRLLSDLIDYARGLPINCAGFDFLLQQYQEHQRASGKIMGFTEASLFVRDAIMQEDSPVKKGIIGKYSCILIDEFQDVNVLQNSIFEPFYDVGSINFTFVGDDDQSIYYWRGSDNTIIKNLVGKPNCKTTYLLTNYRNNPNIVEAGNAILSTIQNRAKKGKPIHANRATGEKIRVTTYNSKFTNLVNEINILLASGKSADEICILSRDRRTANSIRDELTAADIPVSKEDSIIVLSDMYGEMKAILSILNAYDITASAKKLISVTQSVNVTERHIQKIVKGRCTEVECEDSLKKVKALSDEVRLNQITSLADAVDRFSIKAGELYEGRVNEHHSDEVFEQFEEYCQNTSAPWPVPRAQLKEIFSTFEDNAKKRAVSGKPLTPGVRISTIHSAKGLEYDIVIITGLSAGQYPNTEQIDRKYAERNEQLKTFQESRACYYRQKQELDQSVFPTLLEECDSPIFTEAERDRMQDFQQELFDMRDGLLTLSADGVEEYLDAYVYFMTPLIAQYSSDIAKLNTELLNKQSEAEEMKEQILVATSDTAEDESNYDSQLEELCKSIADIGESIERLKIKRNRFFEATANLNNFYVQCLTVKGLLADMARADEIEELQQELKVEREQRTNEERRLFYVAVTRARDYLYLCYEAGTQPSEFIRLIPEKLKAEHIMMTLEEERDYRRIANSMHKEVSKATVDEHKLNEQADQILGQEQLNQYVLKKSEEFARSHVVFSQLSPSAKSYYDRAVGLLFVAEATGENFNTEFAHNMQRMAETILQEFSGPAATPFITMDSAIIDRIVSDIRRIAQKGCRTSPPAVGYLTRLLSEPDPHGDELTTLKNAGIQHFVVRSGKYKINEDVVKSWSNSSRLSQPDRFLTAAIDLANMRNTLIHRDPAAWPEDAVPLILSNAEILVGECSVAGDTDVANVVKRLTAEYVRFGMRVRHDTFGLGRIVDVQQETFTVLFESGKRAAFAKWAVEKSFALI